MSLQVELLGTPSQTYITRGSTYVASALGIIIVSNPSFYDIQDLINNGCVFNVATEGVLLGRLLGANANTTTDQPFAMTMWSKLVNYRVTKITAKNASANLTTANGGVWTGAAKTGTSMVANTQVYSALTGSTLALDLTLVAASANTVLPPSTALILSLAVSQGAAATADFYAWGDLYD